MSKTVERCINVERVEDLITVFGSFDENTRRVEDALSVAVVNRGNELKITGDEEMVDKAARVFRLLMTLASKGEQIDEHRVRYLITLVSEGNDEQAEQMAGDVVCITAKGKPIKAKTVGQQHYMKAITKNTITIGFPFGAADVYITILPLVRSFVAFYFRRPALSCGQLRSRAILRLQAPLLYQNPHPLWPFLQFLL